MPFVKIYLRRDHHADRLRAIGDAVHEALVAQANVPVDDRFQVFHVGTEIDAHPTYGGVARSDQLVIIEITLNAVGGRAQRAGGRRNRCALRPALCALCC